VVYVVRCNAQFYANNNICLCACAELAEGEVETDVYTIQCPLHGSQFSFEIGRFPMLLAIPSVSSVMKCRLLLANNTTRRLL
jgi:nitrite reductase/ring-hydroxylating ferredoxin subunit